MRIYNVSNCEIIYYDSANSSETIFKRFINHNLWNNYIRTNLDICIKCLEDVYISLKLPIFKHSPTPNYYIDISNHSDAIIFYKDSYSIVNIDTKSIIKKGDNFDDLLNLTNQVLIIRSGNEYTKLLKLFGKRIYSCLIINLDNIYRMIIGYKQSHNHSHMMIDEITLKDDVDVMDFFCILMKYIAVL